MKGLGSRTDEVLADLEADSLRREWQVLMQEGAQLNTAMTRIAGLGDAETLLGLLARLELQEQRFADFNAHVRAFQERFDRDPDLWLCDGQTRS